MSQRESVVLMDFFEILDGFTKSFDQDFTGQGRTRPFTRPKWNQVLEDFADLSPPSKNSAKLEEFKKQIFEDFTARFETLIRKRNCRRH